MLNKIALGIVLSGSAALPMTALADEPIKELRIGAGGSTAAALTVVRDAETGLLRAPTAEELATLQSQASSRRQALRTAPATPLTKYHGNGATGVRLTEEMMSYSVIVRRPDGSLSELCFASKEEADAAVRTGSLTVATGPATK
eukprot:Opistho-2@51358